MIRLSRRALLAGAGALAGCGRRRQGGFPGCVVVANQQGRSIAVVDLMELAVAGRIRLRAAPAEVLAHGARRAAYVLCPETGEIHEIDGARRELKRSMRLGSPAARMLLDPGGASIWALCRDPHALVRVGLETLRVEARLRLPEAGADFDLSGRGVAAVTFPDTGRVGLARPQAPAIEAFARVGERPFTVRFQQDGRQLLVGNRGNRTITVVNAGNARVVVHLPLPLEPVNFCFNSDGGQLFVSGPGMDAVVIVYPYRTEVAETILAGRAPDAMASSDTPPYLYVANPETSSVTVLNIAARRLVARVGVGTDPGQILITPGGQFAMVLNRGTGDMAVMRVAALHVELDGKTRRYTAPPLFALIPVGRGPVSGAVLAT